MKNWRQFVKSYAPIRCNMTKFGIFTRTVFPRLLNLLVSLRSCVVKISSVTLVFFWCIGVCSVEKKKKEKEKETVFCLFGLSTLVTIIKLGWNPLLGRVSSINAFQLPSVKAHWYLEKGCHGVRKWPGKEHLSHKEWTFIKENWNFEEKSGKNLNNVTRLIQYHWRLEETVESLWSHCFSLGNKTGTFLGWKGRLYGQAKSRYYDSFFCIDFSGLKEI